MSKPKRVMLIDDDEDYCFFFETALESFEPPVSFSYDQDSQAAFNKLKGSKIPIPDVLFLDWNMPKLPGKDFLIGIRRIPEYQKVPIVVYTTSTALSDKIDAENLGATYFLSKQNTVQDLRAKLNDIFSRDW